MKKLSREDLYSLEQYAEKRGDMRTEVMQHKKNRRLAIGPNATLYFEDLKTIQYQIQEMLRTERVFEAEGINEELEAYNPLIPDGKNLKATFMLEYADEAERRVALGKLLGIEEVVWLKVGDNEKVTPISNEDLERSTDTKTSSVHFMRFEFTDAMIKDWKGGATLTAGIDHSEYGHTVDPVADNIANSLVKDFD